MTRRPRPSRHRLVQYVQLGLLATLVLLILLYNVSFTRHDAATTTTTFVARENLERFRQRHPHEDTHLRIQQHDTTPRGRRPRPNGFTTSAHIKKPPPRQYTADDFANCTLLRPDDSIYRYGDDWDGAPIVVEAYRLLFFTVPKVGCTVWKQCFRRVAGYDDWREDRHPLPHAPARNGLTYLYDLPPTVAETVMTAPDWTRAIFVRDPRERLLSAYLDKGRDNRYLQHHCCSTTATRRGESEVNNTLDRLLHCHDDDDDNGVLAQRDKEPLVSFEGFIKHVVPMCEDKHWKPQADRLEEKFWVRLGCHCCHGLCFSLVSPQLTCLFLVAHSHTALH